MKKLENDLNTKTLKLFQFKKLTVGGRPRHVGVNCVISAYILFDNDSDTSQ